MKKLLFSGPTSYSIEGHQRSLTNRQYVRTPNVSSFIPVRIRSTRVQRVRAVRGIVECFAPGSHHPKQMAYLIGLSRQHAPEHIPPGPPNTEPPTNKLDNPSERFQKYAITS